MTDGGPIAAVEAVTHRYGRLVALDRVSLDVPAGRMIGLVGPDGVGKSTLLGLLAGAKRQQSGRIRVLGGDMGDRRHRARACPRIAYMPQGLGRNLYPDLSVAENIDFFGRLFGLGRVERRQRLAELCAATGLAPFLDRPARKLSGGMRQKLGLCCALVHDPDLLILDEPTTGVDPLSRRQFWQLIAGMRGDRPDLSVIVATAYMEEAEPFDWLVVMNGGRVLATGAPAEIERQTRCATLEASFVALVAGSDAPAPLVIAPLEPDRGRPPVVVARDLTRRFGDFVAVDRVGFSIARGEIFGFVGSNGCGKTTTMKMLTGLLPASAGEARLFGRPTDAADLMLRRRIGYMSQTFSLYGELTVEQNLALHARLFRLDPDSARRRIEALIEQFGLGAHRAADAAGLPLGIRQRLSLAVAVVHEPDLLILDEPTSGVDPLARDRFWAILADLSRRQGVTIFVSTHFMNEAARCDRVALMDAGRVLALGTPAELVAESGGASLEDAFIGHLAAITGSTGGAAPALALRSSQPAVARLFSPGRLVAYAIREALELRRDPVRLAFAVVGTAFLMLVLGFGINTDVDQLPFAVLDRDRTPESRAYLEELRGSRYFAEQPAIADAAELDRRLAAGDFKVAIEIPAGFGRKLRGGRTTEVGAWIDGAMPFRAETTRGYLQGVHQQFLADDARAAGRAPVPALATIETRFRYNQDFSSVFAMVPATIALLLALVPAILMALAAVRERELGSITNLYVTPVTRAEFVLGKQLPYIALALANAAGLVAMAILLFGVPLTGSALAFALGALAYVTATTAYGFVISAFAGSQIAALFGTAILTVLPATQFSGLLVPVAALSGMAWTMGHLFPMTYFLPISVGAFTKALGIAEVRQNLLWLSLFVPALVGASILLLPRQER